MQSVNVKSRAIDMPLLEKNSQGRDVAYLQYLLISYGINIGPSGIDGKFSNDTQNAVRNFQTLRNQVPNFVNPEQLTVDGIVGVITWRALGDNFYRTCNTPIPGSANPLPNITGNDLPLLQIGHIGEAVRFLQQMLLGLQEITQFPGNLGNGAFDAKFGPVTQQAVIAFQRYAGITQDGIVAQSTWTALFQASGARCKGTIA